MPAYHYIARSLDGKKKKGQREAKNERDLAQLLRGEGYFLVSTELKEAAPKKRSFSFDLGRVSLTQKLMATRNLQVMIAAGVSLPKALEILSLQTKSKYFKKVLQELKEKIMKGESLSSALSDYPRVFPEIYWNMVRVGEKTGKMEEILGLLALQLERNYQLRSKIKGAMVYPSVIIGAMVLIGVTMLIKVVPQLSNTFKELQISLPPMTRFVIGLGNFFASKWYVVILVLVGLPILVFLWARTPSGKKELSKIFLKTPFLSGLTKKINSAYAALTLSALIQGGVPIVTALDIASGSVNNFYFKQSLKQSAQKVKRGEKLSNAFSSFPKLYSELFIQMIRVGEETGETSQMLTRLAEFFEDQVNNTTKNLSSIIEPVLLLLVGAAVGFFAISMVQPIYSIMGGM